MRKFVLTVVASLLSCSFAQAFWPEATDSSLEIGVGYRQDYLKWNTHANLNSHYNSEDYSSELGENIVGLPLSVKSKLKWKDINICQIEARGNYVTCDNIYMRASGDYGWISSGKNRDKDYIDFGCGEASYGDEFADSHSKVKGNVYDVKLAVGYQFQFCDDTFTLSPLFGYSWHGQHFRDRHLRQNFFLDGVNAAAFSASRSHYDYYDYENYYYPYSDSCSCDYSYGGQHSTYHTRWNGPFIGFDFDYSLCCDWDLFGGYEFHFAEFHARGKWDLRSDLRNGFYQHSKNAYGQVFDIGVKWDMCDCWTLAVRGEFQFWHARHGRDRSKTNDVNIGNVKTKCFLDIPTRNTEWCSSSVMFDLGMVF
jgi:hypothetical protein